MTDSVQAFVDRMVEKHNELGKLLAYPPVGASEKAVDLHTEGTALIDVEVDKHAKMEGFIDYSIYHDLNTFSKLEEEFKDDLEEARLWQKRYPNDPEKAWAVYNKDDSKK